MKNTSLPGAVRRARELRRRLTDAEKRLWWALRERLPGLHFRRQVPFGRYVADFCCHAEKLIVEVDGGQHDEVVDAARIAFLESRGYRVIRFWNTAVLAETEGVITTILSELRGCHPHLTSPVKGEGLSGGRPEGRPLPFDGEGQGGVAALGGRAQA